MYPDLMHKANVVVYRHLERTHVRAFSFTSFADLNLQQTVDSKFLEDFAHVRTA